MRRFFCLAAGPLRRDELVAWPVLWRSAYYAIVGLDIAKKAFRFTRSNRRPASLGAWPEEEVVGVKLGSGRLSAPPNGPPAARRAVRWTIRRCEVVRMNT